MPKGRSEVCPPSGLGGGCFGRLGGIFGTFRRKSSSDGAVSILRRRSRLFELCYDRFTSFVLSRRVASKGFVYPGSLGRSGYQGAVNCGTCSSLGVMFLLLGAR